MTPVQYWARWIAFGLVSWVLARYTLVQPIIDAITR